MDIVDGYINDRAFYRTPFWRDLCAKTKARDRTCRLCNSPSNLVVHHRRYPGHGKETTSDLTTLCEECHNLFHAAQANLRRSLSKRDRRKGIKNAIRAALRNKTIKKPRKRPKNRHGGHARIKSDAEVSMADTMLRNLQTAKEAARRQLQQAEQSRANADSRDAR